MSDAGGESGDVAEDEDGGAGEVGGGADGKAGAGWIGGAALGGWAGRESFEWCCWGGGGEADEEGDCREKFDELHCFYVLFYFVVLANVK